MTRVRLFTKRSRGVASVWQHFYPLPNTYFYSADQLLLRHHEPPDAGELSAEHRADRRGGRWAFAIRTAAATDVPGAGMFQGAGTDEEFR
jgi:hypothetical protein